MQWVWILSFSILGSQPEHGQQAKFETKLACQQALANMIQTQSQLGREVVGRCYMGQSGTTGWWK
jgi:hypothetical protein